MCTNCNQNSNTPCGCNNGVYQEVNICTQCPPEVPCTCPIKDLSTDCVLYNQDDIVCGATIVVPKNTILSVALQQIVFWACTKFTELQNYFRLLNIGVGAEIYAGNTLIGEKKLRKINSSNTIITVTQNTDDISIGIDETILDDFIEANQKTYSVANIGTGEDIYKDSTFVLDNTQFNLKKLKSDTLDITTSVDGNTINIEQTDSAIPAFIVNSDYTGLQELGTRSKPFKNLQNALTAYKGIGTNLLPQYVGTIIDIEKDANVFIGSLAYAELNLILRKGANLTSNPATGEFILDCDSDAILPIGMTAFSNTYSGNFVVTIEEGATIALQKQGFKNRGTTLNTNNSLGKIVRLLGKGLISIDSDISIVSPSVRTIISANADNQVGFFNDGNVAQFDVQCKIITATTKIIDAGLNTEIYLTNMAAQFGDTLQAFNVNTKPYVFNSSTLVINSSNFQNYNSGLLLLESQFYLNGLSSLQISDSNLGGDVNYLFKNLSSSLHFLQLRNCNHDGNITSGIISSPTVYWNNLRFINNYFYSGVINPTEGALVPNFTNNIGGQIVETLSKYDDRAAAVLAGLFSGCKFINTGGVVSPTTGWFIDMVM